MTGRKTPKAGASLPPAQKPGEIPPVKPKRGGRRFRSGGKSVRPAKPEEGKSGRPSLLDAKLEAEIILSVAEYGMAESRAALAAGVTPGAVTKWKQRGRAAADAWDDLTPEQQVEEARYVSFFKALRDAEPYFERSNLSTIHAAAKTDWRAAKARLEMRFPLKYGKRVMLGGDPENKAPIVTAAPTSDLSNEEIKARAERILKASAAARPPAKVKGKAPR